ncbi:MAG: oxygen-independent coproporphyrinogen III oxidase [Candidatus Melainabacteria bacterium]|nr:oxygen-independent coproporphyrinogen III oxidase [Candidatus Melainabacteria bacterium]MBI3307771.1 oxygen-independent coproporphyrinogen III oxidase [Candidatus Melainabacteria bacterium]
MQTKSNLNKELLHKYSVSIPRYTSYPTAPQWNEDFTENDFLKANEVANKVKSPISLYFHLPFCEEHCNFCACNVVISKKKEIVGPYLARIIKEINHTGKLISKERKVEQIHLGGGTPTFFSLDELSQLFGAIEQNFTLSDTCETGIEIDPRVTKFEHIETLSQLGFNRLSMGIQDFDPKVQKAINRIQPYDETKELFTYARDHGFMSINVDLIYGLPYQTLESFKRTIDLILAIDPDRIALFHYAHLPELLPHQAKYIEEKALPSSDIKIEIFQYAVDVLTKSGFVFIGLDHFAKENDELAIARKNNTLHRNFQGYTTKSSCDLYGFGITAISNIQNSFSQNLKKLNPYYEEVDKGKAPVFKGIYLNKDDMIRKEIIMKILCNGVLLKDEIESKYKIEFNKYFLSELDKLKNLVTDGLVELHKNTINVTQLGQFFLRNIACVFDYYLNSSEGKQKIFSKSI